MKSYWNTHLCKKEISRNKDAKEKAQDIVKVNVIKPQPRTLSNNFIWLSGKPKPTTGESFEQEDNVNNITLALTASESRIKWWANLLDDKECDERATCATSGLDKEPRDIWTEKIAPEAKGGDTF